MKHADIIQTLDLEQKCALLSGGTVFDTRALPGKGIRVKEVDQKPILPLADHFLDRCRARRDDKTAGGQCFKHRPREHKGVPADLVARQASPNHC